MLHRVERIARIGRNYGIGTSFISQQPQSVAKRCLNQCSTLFSFRAAGKHERKAIIEWFSDKSGDVDTDVLFDSLKRLERGTAYVASVWLRNVDREVRIVPKVTFDSSRTPEFGETLVKPKVLAEVDKAALREAWSAVVEEAEKDDPAALRREIADLKRQLAARPAPTPAKTQTVEVPVIPDAQVGRLEKAVERLTVAQDRLAQAQQVVASEAGTLSQTIRSFVRDRRALPAALPAPALGRVIRTMPLQIDRESFLRSEKGVTRPAPRAAPDGDGPQLRAGARTMLRVLAGASGGTMTRTELAVHAVMAQSGTYSDYLSTLRSAEYIVDREDGRVEITHAGQLLVDQRFGGPVHRGARELMQAWFNTGRLRAGARVMLNFLVNERSANDTASFSREQLAAAASMTVSGTFGDYLSTLHSSGLVEKNGQLVRASNALFLYGS
jgi:hypothetical protein